MKIYKYPLLRSDSQVVKMPEKSEILDIQMQDTVVMIWAIVDESSEIENVIIDMIGTGRSPRKGVDKYIATVQDGDFVWHYFRN